MQFFEITRYSTNKTAEINATAQITLKYYSVDSSIIVSTKDS